MLPFLKPRAKNSGIATVYRAPDEGKESEGSDLEGLHAAADDLHKAIQANDIKAIAAALKAAFEILDAAPHQEGPHESDEGQE